MLPKSIDPVRLCKQGAVLQGAIMLSTLSRLQDLCDQAEQAVGVVLTLDVDANGTRFIQGAVKGAVRLCCQRCNGEMTQLLDLTFALSPVNTYERVKKLSSAYEPLMISDEPVVLAEMIEDEILLVLPMVARHEEGECQ
ncbi:MAG: YceD family protein [Coxiellaceae bacterium]|nr:YceD family protein [Coxiellaceae bacterium]